jgi:hypothetical protein
LSASELEALKAVGLNAAPFNEGSARDPLTRSITDYMALLETSYSTTQAAKYLKVDASRVRQRLREHSLFGIDYDGEKRLPRFQFERAHVIRRLREVLAALPEGLNPLDVAEWFKGLVAKVPNSRGVDALARFTPSLGTLAAGTKLARVYFSRGPHPQVWDQFRHFGPLPRWDHHVLGADGNPSAQKRGIYYAAIDAKTCFAEAFQVARRIDRVFQAPWLVVFETLAPLKLLDLTGDFATPMGASMAIHSGSRGRARGWARDLYEAYPQIQGILYAASMHGGQHAIALNERALTAPVFPAHPLFHRALGDDIMLDPLKHAARVLGYALR